MIRFRRSTYLAAAAAAVMFLAGAVALAQAAITDVNNRTPFTSLAPGAWGRPRLSEGAVCSGGEPYEAWVRRGTSDNIIVHFSGGGACWDGETCSQPLGVTDFSGFYIPRVIEVLRAFLGGIFDLNMPDNPLRDWNIVYLPYCTADFHIGAATNTYTTPSGAPLTIHHNGWQNVNEVLEWVFTNLDSPEKLIVSGESAGGFATLFWTPTLAAYYSDAEVYQIADGVYLNTPQWDHIINQVWKADAPNRYGVEVHPDLAGGVFSQWAENPRPNLTTLHINTAYDGVLLYFNTYLNGDSADAAADPAGYREAFSRGLRESMAGAAQSGLPYYFYLTDFNPDPRTGETSHTALSAALLYQLEEDDVVLAEWLRRIIIDGERFSVGESLLPQ